MIVKQIRYDGLPDPNDSSLTGRIAFIFDGCIVSGWHIPGEPADHWEADSDVGRVGTFTGIELYVIFDRPVWDFKGYYPSFNLAEYGSIIEQISKVEGPGRQLMMSRVMNMIQAGFTKDKIIIEMVNLAGEIYEMFEKSMAYYSGPIPFIKES